MPDDHRLDPAEVAALYAQHGEELKRFLIGVLRDPQLAYDALQAAFAKLAEVGHTSQQETRKAWLFRVAYNEALAVRRRRAVGDKVLRKLAGSAEAKGDDSTRPLLRLETVTAVRDALNRLPLNQQQIVRMRIYEEKTFACIAEELEIPLGTALGRMRSAAEKLRRALSEHSPKDSAD